MKPTPRGITDIGLLAFATLLTIASFLASCNNSFMRNNNREQRALTGAVIKPVEPSKDIIVGYTKLNLRVRSTEELRASRVPAYTYLIK